MIKKQLSYLVISLSLIFSSCSPIEIKDYVFCGDLGRFGATCVHSLKTEIPAKRIMKTDWDAMRIGYVCTEANTIADIQASIDKLCNKNKSMCYYAKEGVDTAKKTLTNIQSATK